MKAPFSAVLLSEPATGVRQVTLNRPSSLNALNHELVRDLHAALDVIEQDASCHVVVLTGAGRGFCAGLDLEGYGDDDARRAKGTTRGLLEQQRDIVGIAQRLHRLRQPVIAAVNGAAAGGGMAFALACDIRMASDQAAFAVSFINAGFSGCDIGTSWLLPRLVGAGRAHELMLTGRKIDAREALHMGLVTDVVPAEYLLERALAMAGFVLAHPPLSVELTKQGMWLALEVPSFDAAVEFENRQQVLTAMTDDQAEALQAWSERRAPTFNYR